jgi:hypothetical protein
VHAERAIDEQAWQGTDLHWRVCRPHSQQKLFLCFIREVDWHGTQAANLFDL